MAAGNISEDTGLPWACPPAWLLDRATRYAHTTAFSLTYDLPGFLSPYLAKITAG